MPWSSARVQSCLVLCAVVACAIALCAGCGSSSPAASTQASQANKCVVSSSGMLTSRDMPGFVEAYRITHVTLPGSHGMTGHTPWDVTQYVCGQTYEFLSNVIMYGRYRAEDNAKSRSLGYSVGKIPLLPYEGQAVSQLPHGVFQADEEIFQFRSAKAAGMWLANALWTPTPPDNLAGLPLPSGFIARAGVSGPDNGQDEHGIGISGQRGNLVIVVSFNGGRKLAWSDVQAFWSRAYTYLAKTL
jgi:hypothetical protein